MRKMKDSGIEWIGEIPESWASPRMKFYTEIDSGEMISKEEFDENGEFPVIGSNGEIGRTYKNNNQNSVITTGRVGTVGTVQIVENAWITDNALIIKPKINIGFLKYVIPNFDFDMMLSGTAQPLITATKLKNQGIPLPSEQEQTRIADYLDKKCAEIDAIIAAKEKTNELLKERRQSIIYEAVTKGLDPTVPMKDSGVEWIGMIPESWEIERLKYHIEFNPTTDIPEYEDDQQISFLPMECLRRGTHTSQVVDYEKVKKGYVIFQDNDILMAKVTPCLENGNIAIAQGLIDGIGFGSTEINVIRCTSIHREYLFYMLQCKTYIERAVADMYGVAGLKRLNPSFIPNTKYPIPSSAEQERIAEYLNRVCGEFDALIAANNVTIEKLKEYRQSVIYEAVTGKVEI